MRDWRLVPVLVGVLVSFALATPPARAADTPAKAQAAALTGAVSGPDGAPLEGVIVTAGHPGSNITVSVVTDANGRYSFPAGKLAPGGYFLSIRAAGYELAGDGAAQVGGKQTAATDLKLKPAHDLAAQLTNAEWISSFPGTDRAKEHADQLRRLPHAGADRALDPYRRRMGNDHRSHEPLRAGQPADQAAEARRRA